MSIGEPSFVLTAILTLLLKLINTLLLLRRPKEESAFWVPENAIYIHVDRKAKRSKLSF